MVLVSRSTKEEGAISERDFPYLGHCGLSSFLGVEVEESNTLCLLKDWVKWHLYNQLVRSHYLKLSVSLT